MAGLGYVLKNRRTTLERAEKFVSDIYFQDCNLKSKLFSLCTPLARLQFCKAPGRVPYDEAVKYNYSDVQPGASFGPTWATVWFRVELVVPSAWCGHEVVLRWDSDAECMVWQDGQPAQGLTAENKRSYFTIVKEAPSTESRHVLYVEMGCNGLFGAGSTYQIAPTDPDRHFTIKKAETAVIDRKVYTLLMDFEIVIGMAKHLAEDSNRAFQALYTANEMVNACDVTDSATYERAHEIAANFFAQGNGASQHTVCAVGHCHIDTAWLWPYAETIRKCARSWVSTVRLMDQYPHFKFACSQAQQFAALQLHYPALYERIRQRVVAGQFLPVGGTWVEMDGNLPSGEAFCRQFLLGQRYFRKNFGITCKEFWLPDTFGYSGQLPQIMRQAGITRFLTQKLSWNLVNKFPHHTFHWAGVDGSTVLVHFPPSDSYTMLGTVKELVYAIKNFQDKGRSNQSLVLFGWGDGGQGPTEDMIERLDRMRDIDGLPKVEMCAPGDFFTRVEETDSRKLCAWHGELFFELHNGTYTSQFRTKQNNRRCEFLLRDVEMAATLAWLTDLSHSNKTQHTTGGSSHSAPLSSHTAPLPSHTAPVSRGGLEKPEAGAYPAVALLALWKLLLLNQFHDVLPGSSIGLVYEDAESHYAEIKLKGSKLLVAAIERWIGTDGGVRTAVAVNTLSWARTEVVTVPRTDQPATKRKKDLSTYQVDSTGNTLVLSSAPSCGYRVLEQPETLSKPVSAETKEHGCIYLQNEHVRVVVDRRGRISHLYASGSTRNVVSEAGLCNQFVLFDDVPLYWDAWDVMDYHLETRREVNEVVQGAKLVECGPLRATVEFSLKISDQSHITQRLVLDAGCKYIQCKTQVVWQEAHKFLKVEFPVNVRAAEATYEIQMGHLKRPSTFNTSWDWAKFEVCGHKWADVCEYGIGLAVLNDSHYGWSCLHSTLRLSLLRAPKAPDENADMGTHTFSYAIMPHTGSYQDAGVVQAAYALNCPLAVHTVPLPAAPSYSFASVDTPAVILETVKKCEDRHGFVLRLYEAYGGATSATVRLTQQFRAAYVSNILEDVEEDGSPLVENTDSLTLDFTAFQIRTVIVVI